MWLGHSVPEGLLGNEGKGVGTGQTISSLAAIARALAFTLERWNRHVTEAHISDRANVHLIHIC